MENNDWKYSMYSKLSKEELVKLLIEKDEQLLAKPVQFYPLVQPGTFPLSPPYYPTVTTPGVYQPLQYPITVSN